MNFVPQFKTFFDLFQQRKKSVDYLQGLSDTDSLSGWAFTEQEKTMMRNLPKKSRMLTISFFVVNNTYLIEPHLFMV